MNIAAATYNDFVAGKIERFYDEAYPSLLMFAARTLGDDYSFLAEDCVQDAIFKAYEKRSTLGTPAYLKSFLYQCVHNAAVSILRKHNSWQRYHQDAVLTATQPDASTAIIEQETLDRLFEAITRLPDELQSVFALSFEQGLTNAEAGRQLGISESAVKKRKARMIALLRQQFSADLAVQLYLLTLLNWP